MRIGSITKTFMAALALRLAEQGMLALDDPVASHLPAVGIADAATIRDLLTHTAGIRDGDPERVLAAIVEDSGRRFSPDERLAFAEIPTAAVDAPAPHRYANAGYHVLGHVIEEVTGSDVATALRTYVLAPAGLDDTFLAGFEPVPDPIVPGNVDLGGDDRMDSLSGVPYLAVETHAWTAGALVSTPEDLVSFARSLFDGTLLDEESIRELTTTAPGSDYALGLIELENGAGWGHSGGAPGFQANLAHDPAAGTTAVVFTNCPECARSIDTWDPLSGLLAVAHGHS